MKNDALPWVVNMSFQQSDLSAENIAVLTLAILDRLISMSQAMFMDQITRTTVVRVAESDSPSSVLYCRSW